ncbi:MAG: hypothetical protein RBR68_15690, partial [Tenuifilaceae bacterium]|nr:hypothetical protein [Tenuifilaceae bacterium]
KYTRRNENTDKNKVWISKLSFPVNPALTLENIEQNIKSISPSKYTNSLELSVSSVSYPNIKATKKIFVIDDDSYPVKEPEYIGYSAIKVGNELWGTYEKDLDIFVVRYINEVWLDPIKVTVGTNPYLLYDGTMVKLYFENGAKIQTLEFAPESLGLGDTPLQTWDAYDAGNQGVISNITTPKFFDTPGEPKIISMFDDFPHYQPVPAISIYGYLITWTAVPSIPSATITYRLYENDMFIVEISATEYTYKVKSYTKYSITSVYTYFGDKYESLPVNITTGNILAYDSEIADLNNAGFTNDGVNFYNYEIDRLFGTDQPYVNSQKNGGFVNDTIYFYNYEVDQVTYNHGSHDSTLLCIGYTGFINDGVTFYNYDGSSIE